MKESFYEFEGKAIISTTMTPATRSPPVGASKACGPNMFRCENGPCLPESLRCNGNYDCPLDTSDELDCPEMDNTIDSKFRFVSIGFYYNGNALVCGLKKKRWHNDTKTKIAN